MQRRFCSALSPHRASGMRHAIARLVVGSVALSVPAAHAACVHTGNIYSCVDVSGKAMQVYCLGAGVVLTCMEPSGAWILVAPHEVLSQITDNSQVSSALAAKHSRDASTAGSGAPNAGTGSGTDHIMGSTPNTANAMPSMLPAGRNSWQIPVNTGHQP